VVARVSVCCANAPLDKDRQVLGVPSSTSPGTYYVLTVLCTWSSTFYAPRQYFKYDAPCQIQGRPSTYYVPCRVYTMYLACSHSVQPQPRCHRRGASTRTTQRPVRGGGRRERVCCAPFPPAWSPRCVEQCTRSGSPPVPCVFAHRSAVAGVFAHRYALPGVFAHRYAVAGLFAHRYAVPGVFAQHTCMCSGMRCEFTHVSSSS
jgi:hypothetical protein